MYDTRENTREYIFYFFQIRIAWMNFTYVRTDEYVVLWKNNTSNNKKRYVQMYVRKIILKFLLQSLL